MLRKEIRAEVTRILSDFLEIPVYNGKFQPLDSTSVPFLRICALDETSENFLDDSFRRTLNLQVFIYATADEMLDDVLDDLSEKVEQCLLSDRLYGKVQSVDLKSMHMDVATAANRELGIIELNFEIVYDWYLTIAPLPMCSVTGVFESKGEYKMPFEQKVSEE